MHANISLLTQRDGLEKFTANYLPLCKKIIHFHHQKYKRKTGVFRRPLAYTRPTDTLAEKGPLQAGLSVPPHGKICVSQIY